MLVQVEVQVEVQVQVQVQVRVRVRGRRQSRLDERPFPTARCSRLKNRCFLPIPVRAASLVESGGRLPR